MLKVGECKALARRTLLGRYATVIGAYFITIGITFLMWSLTIASGCATLFGAGVLGSMLGSTAVFSFPKLVAGVMLTMFLLIASVFVSLWFEIGSTKLMLNICRGLKYGVSDVFYGFRKGSNTLRFVCIGVVLGLINAAVNFIQRLLFLLAEFVFKDADVPRITAVVLITIVTLIISWYISVSFMLAKIIIADKRETGISRALSTSHRLMKGRKLKGFWLMHLSFFFWYILMFICGPAALWIAPYIACTTIIFYMDTDGTLWQLTDAGKAKAEEVHAEAAADMNISVPTAEDAADKTAAADAETAVVTETATDAAINADEGTNTDAATNADEGSNAATATNADGEAGD